MTASVQDRPLIAEELAEQFAWLIAAMDSGRTSDGPPPHEPAAHLQDLFSLSDFERSLLILCAGAEVDSAIRSRLPDGGAPTFQFALANLPQPHWSAIVPTAPLRRWGLIRLLEGPGLLRSPLRIEERILHLLVGVPYLDDALDGIVEGVEEPVVLAPSHEEVAGQLAELLSSGSTWPRVQLCGVDGELASGIAAQATAVAGLRLLALGAEAIPSDPRELQRRARLVAREAALSGAAVLIRGDLDDPDRGAAVGSFVRALEAAVVVSRRDPAPDLEDAVRIDVRPAPVAEQRLVWESVLGERADALDGALDAVAAQFALAPAAMRAAATEAIARANGATAEPADFAARLWDTCRVRSRPGLEQLAQRVTSTAVWEDLVLGDAERATLSEIAAQVRWRRRVYEEWGFAARGSRGLGISALFAGPTGTGKTMAAEILANELRLDLYRIDLSSVVSKYIGETEKNLRRVFDAAERGGAILLFDEADALFGKRTEVKDSHDRFANIEISYLLQRMEAYGGLAILTTNQRQAIDDAFLRRLRFVVEFRFPEVPERTAIWERVFPDGVPVGSLEPRRLAQLAIAGGNIRNVALGAAFLAADEGQSVEMRHVLRATRSEYAKLERPLTSVELEGWE